MKSSIIFFLLIFLSGIVFGIENNDLADLNSPVFYYKDNYDNEYTNNPAVDNDTTNKKESNFTIRKLFIGINISHTIMVGVISGALGEETLCLPIHAGVQYSFNKRWGISGLVYYRYEKDGFNFKTNGIGFAVGPRISFTGTAVEGFYATVMLGVGFNSGLDYFQRDYRRTDLVIEPEIGYVSPMKLGPFGFAFGFGLQTLIPLNESPQEIQWNTLGKLSHYYLPVINISIGIKK